MLRNEYGRGSSILLCLGLSLLAESAGQDRELVVIGHYPSTRSAGTPTASAFRRSS